MMIAERVQELSFCVSPSGKVMRFRIIHCHPRWWATDFGLGKPLKIRGAKSGEGKIQATDLGLGKPPTHLNEKVQALLGELR